MTQFIGMGGGQGMLSSGGAGYKWGWAVGKEGIIEPPCWHYFEADGVRPICQKKLDQITFNDDPQPPVEHMCEGCRAVLTRRLLEKQGADG